MLSECNNKVYTPAKTNKQMLIRFIHSFLNVQLFIVSTTFKNQATWTEKAQFYILKQGIDKYYKTGEKNQV